MEIAEGEKMRLRMFICTALAGWVVVPLVASANDSSALHVVDSLFKNHRPFTTHPLRLDDRQDLSRYFTKELTELLIKDQQCIQRTHEVCALDFDPVWGGQDDLDSRRLKFSETSESPIASRITVTFVHSELTPVNFIVKNSSGVWRVADISYKDLPSLKDALAMSDNN